MKKGTAGKAAGRPRDEAATASIMRAALELADEAGFDALSVEGVAARAGVGKTTIYRRWANVWAVVMDAVLANLTQMAPIEEHPTARESFRASMRSLAKAYRGKAGKLLRPLIGRAQVDADLRQAVQAQWVEPRRRIARKVVRRGIESGELREGLDADVVLDALYGPIYHRLLVPYDDAPLSDEFIDRVIDHVFGGLERNTAGGGGSLPAHR
ncbi:TetR/AcrR family transcriptional regulator [Singulisphaera acidiphila]|uniref:Transcriptional regulator n=2 Tax=Singulisphaera acidiphila TaxID=466153 RepID=L0DHM5_SINAD|nr:TetR/AcrR family transcriptional regulator [Singulisphaera acidiphila]AGA28350.1 transcriptional regulator [Singulisphaera acidiphila DSM 18658]